MFTHPQFDPVAVHLGPVSVRWYGLMYLFGFGVALLLMRYRARKRPEAGWTPRQVDDLLFYAVLGVILGGRLGYVVFYKPELFLTPIEVLKLWEGGMSLHGGVIGVVVAISWFTRRNRLGWLRVHDYIAWCWPFGQFFGRMANFVNGELWGRPTTQPWGIIFPGSGDEITRHPSQLYQGATEGLLLGIILWFLFWKTDARYYPGRLVGVAILGYGGMRFFTEFYREPDPGVSGLFGFSMGQTLCVPMVLLGLYLILTSKKRRERVEAVAGTASVA